MKCENNGNERNYKTAETNRRTDLSSQIQLGIIKILHEKTVSFLQLVIVILRSELNF